MKGTLDTRDTYLIKEKTFKTMKIADLQCQIKIPFCVCDYCFFWEWNLWLSYLKALVVNFVQHLEAGRKRKPSFPLITGKGQLWYEQIWLMFDKFASHVLNLKVHRSSTGHMKTRKPSSTKMWGRYPQVSGWLVGTMFWKLLNSRRL